MDVGWMMESRSDVVDLTTLTAGTGSLSMLLLRSEERSAASPQISGMAHRSAPMLSTA
jgi:hypothetical protein